jgi:hypothetical protein
VARFLVEGSSTLLTGKKYFLAPLPGSSLDNRVHTAHIPQLDVDAGIFEVPSRNRNISYPPQIWYHMNPNARCSRQTA